MKNINSNLKTPIYKNPGCGCLLIRSENLRIVLNIYKSGLCTNPESYYHSGYFGPEKKVYIYR